MMSTAEIRFPCCNYDSGRSKKISLIVIHATRSGLTYGSDWERTINWFNNPDASASSHLLIGKDGSKGRFVSDADTAWHCGAKKGSIFPSANPCSLGMEIEQRRIVDPFTDESIISAAESVRNWCNKFGIPKQRTFHWYAPGIIGHQDSEQGQEWGKDDPGYLFPWDKFIEMINMSDQELNVLRLQLALVRAIVENRLQDAFNILKYVGMK